MYILQQSMAHPLGGEKLNFLQQLVHIKYLVEDSLWIVAGDFNLIGSLQEKKGGV